MDAAVVLLLHGRRINQVAEVLVHYFRDEGGKGSLRGESEREREQITPDQQSLSDLITTAPTPPIEIEEMQKRMWGKKDKHTF